MLDAARTLVAESGVRGSSVSAIAQRAAVGKPSVYLRWPNHTSILVAAISGIRVAVEPVSALSTRDALTDALDEDHAHVLAGPHAGFLRSVPYESAFNAELSTALWAGILGPRRERLTDILHADPAVASSRPRRHPGAIADLLQAPCSWVSPCGRSTRAGVRSRRGWGRCSRGSAPDPGRPSTDPPGQARAAAAAACASRA